MLLSTLSSELESYQEFLITVWIIQEIDVQKTIRNLHLGRVRSPETSSQIESLFSPGNIVLRYPRRNHILSDPRSFAGVTIKTRPGRSGSPENWFAYHPSRPFPLPQPLLRRIPVQSLNITGPAFTAIMSVLNFPRPVIRYRSSIIVTRTGETRFEAGKRRKTGNLLLDRVILSLGS